MFNININPILALSLFISSFSVFASGGEYGGRFNTGLLSYGGAAGWFWNPAPSNCSSYNTQGHPANAQTGTSFWCGSGPLGYVQGFNYLGGSLYSYPDDRACSVKIEFLQYAGGSGYIMNIVSGTIVGMTKSGNTFVSNSGSMKCRDYIQQGGISWGYFQDLDVRGPALWQNYQYRNIIVARMEVSWSGGSHGNTGIAS